MEKVDVIIQAGWIIPVVPSGAVLADHALAIQGGMLVAIGPCAEIKARYSADQYLERPEHVLIPGLINTHTHAAMTLFRGMADDMPLEQWLSDYIWPAETRWAGPDFVRDGTELAIAEMLLGGTTCFQDMYFYPDIVAKTAASWGIRAVVGMIVIEMPTTWASSPDEYFSKGMEVHDLYQGHALIKTAFAPHAPYTVSDQTFERLRMLADELDAQVHMHLHETEQEISDSLTAHGSRPIARVDRMGLLNNQLAAVHMTQLEPAEIELLADRGVSVVHCPESNLKLASGFAPVRDLLAAGVNVALGTDGAGSNNDLDMFGEMRTAALLGKGLAQDATAVSAEQTLAMATINGARALGLSERIGSLEVGKQADIACINLARPATQPVHQPLSLVVYSATRDQVSDVWVAGRQLVADGNLVADQADVMERAQAWQKRLGKNHD